MSDEEGESEDRPSKLSREILANLTPGEAKVLRGRFGVNLSETYSSDEVGKQFEITRKQIRAIEEKALRKIQRNSRKVPAEPICSFCGKSESEVKKLIKADSGVTICDECLQVFTEIINDPDND